MEGRGGCCIARLPNGAVYDISKADRIMLKFRPIAPKPVAVSGGTSCPPESSELVSTNSTRGKRRYNKERKSTKTSDNNKKVNTNRCRRKRKASSSEETESTHKSGDSVDTVVTLPLLPETPERRESSPVKNRSSPLQVWWSFDSSNKDKSGHVSVSPLVYPLQPVTSVVTLECVNDTWTVGCGHEYNKLGCTDEERVLSLARDTCPGFVTDAANRVTWSNAAYREMVGTGFEGEEVMVWVVMKEEVPIKCNAFSCRVRVRSTCRKKKGSMTVPCDVWRMDGGGFAWRLDVEAALCLGR